MGGITDSCRHFMWGNAMVRRHTMRDYRRLRRSRAFAVVTIGLKEQLGVHCDRYKVGLTSSMARGTLSGELNFARNDSLQLGAWGELGAEPSILSGNAAGVFLSPTA